jgi:hypothetical protein
MNLHLEILNTSKRLRGEMNIEFMPQLDRGGAVNNFRHNGFRN